MDKTKPEQISNPIPQGANPMTPDLSRFENLHCDLHPDPEVAPCRPCSARTKFIAEINGVYGVWQRHGPKGRKLKLLVRVDRDARRDKQWDFYKIAERTVQQRLIKDMRDTLADALRLTAERARWR